MASDQCPACMTPMGPSELSCPICMRRRTRKELMAALQAPKRQMRSRRRLAGWAVLAAAGAACSVYWRAQSAPHAGTAATASAPAPGEGAAPGESPQAPAPPSPSPVVPAAPSAPPGALTPDQSAALTSLLRHDDRNGSPDQARPTTQAGEASTPAAPQEAPAPAVWTISGQAYDLFSLKPVAGAKVTFQDSSGKRYRATTGASGRYRARLPRPLQGGYAISVKRAGYRDDYLEEGDPPFRKQSEGRREDAAYQAAESTVLHVPVTAGEDGSLREDLVLIPLD